MRKLLQRMRGSRPSEPAATQQAATPPRKRRWLRRTVWSVVALAAIGLPLALWFLPSAGLRYVINQQLRNAGMSTVDIAEVNVSLTGGLVEVRRAAANAPAGPEGRLADLAVAFEWRPLLNGRVSLGSVGLRGLQLEVSHAADGRLVISGLPLPEATGYVDEQGQTTGWLIGTGPIANSTWLSSGDANFIGRLRAGGA